MQSNTDLADLIARRLADPSGPWHVALDHGPLTQHCDYLAAIPLGDSGYGTSALFHAQQATTLSRQNGTTASGFMTDPLALRHVRAAIARVRDAHHIQVALEVGHTDYFGLLVASAFEVLAPRNPAMRAEPPRVIGHGLALPSPVEILVIEDDEVTASESMDRLVEAWFGGSTEWIPATVIHGVCGHHQCKHTHAEHALFAVDPPVGFTPPSDSLFGQCRSRGCPCTRFVTPEPWALGQFTSDATISN